MASLSTPPDEVLVRYILGELSPVEADPLDERSVVDPDFFERLDAVENDLVDAYVRRELPPALQDRFRQRYVTSEARAEKLRFASALAQRHQRTATVIPMKPRASAAVPWLLPLAATIAVVGLGLWFLPEDGDLPNGTQQAQQQSAPSPEPTQPASPSAVDAPAPTPKESLFAFTLAAPRRGVDDLQAISIPASATSVTVRAELEIDDFPRYRAILKNPGTGRVLWRSSVLTAEGQRTSRVVPVMIPARHFDTQRYFLELEGLSAGGTAEPITTYAFRVVR
jgi:hypothetical protein